MSEQQEPGDPGAAERDRLARTLRETRLQLAMTQARLAALEQSATMELGRTLVRAARRPWSRGVQLPADLVRLWRERGGLTGPGAATLALASAQLGDLAGGGERFLSALTAPGLGAPGAAAPGWAPPGLVITGVLTARACATLAPDAAVLPLLPHDADVMLESAGADLVLIEAAAMLAGSAWAYAGDPAATDRGRRLGRLIAAARALGKPVIFVRNVPAHLAPGLDWVAASCDAVSEDGFGVQLARFNPIGLAGSRPGHPVYAGPRDPRQTPAVRALLDAIAADTGPGSVGVTGSVPWHRLPELYREHALFVTASADQAGEQLACGARVIMIGGEPAAGGVPVVDDPAALREKLAELEARPPRSAAETLPVLREIFTAQATPARLAALAKLAGLGDDVIAGRRIGVLSRAADAATAAALSAGLAGQRLLPSELVVLAEAPDAASAELSARAVTATLTGLADRGVDVRAVPVVTGESSSWLRCAATAARSPWVVPWQAQREYRDTYLLDLACARECGQARRGRVQRIRLCLHRRARSGAGPARVLRRRGPRSRATPLLRELRSIHVDPSGARLRRHRPEPHRRFGHLAAVRDAGAGPRGLCGDAGTQGAGPHQPADRAAAGRTRHHRTAALRGAPRRGSRRVWFAAARGRDRAAGQARRGAAA